ncbi:MAG: ABC transporter substrate-binding protein [Mycoplasmatales bacterium]
MKKLLVLLIAFVVVLTGCKNTDDLTKVKVMLDYVPNTNHTGLYVAQDLGFFEDEGLEVEILNPGESGTEVAVDQNIAQFGISYEENLSMAVDKGMNITSIAAVLQENTSGFVSRKESNVTKENLGDKTYCGWGTEIEENLVNYAAGKKVKQVVGSNGFINGGDGCDFYWEYAAWSLVEAKMAGIDFNFIPITDYIDFYSPIIITNQKMLDEQPKVVKKFMKAVKKGYEYASTNPEDSAEIFSKANPDYEKDFIVESCKFIAPYYVDDKGEFGSQDKDVWTNFTSFLNENNMIDEENVDKINASYTNEYL